jgi:hypothetical protein
MNFAGIWVPPCFGAPLLIFWLSTSPNASLPSIQALQPPQVIIHNPTALKIEVATARVSPASGHLIVTLRIINTYPTALTAFVMQLPSEGTGRRAHGRDYFGSDKPAGLQPGQEDTVIIVLPDSLSTHIEVSGLLLAGGDRVGRDWAIAELLARRQGHLDQAMKAIAILSEYHMIRDLEPAQRLLFIKGRIDGLEDENPNWDTVYAMGMRAIKIALSRRLQEIASRNLTEESMSAAILELIERWRSYVLAIQ